MNKTVVSPFAIIWFCTAADPSVIMPDYHNSMLPDVHSNRVYSPDGTANVTCGYSGGDDKTLVPLSRFTDAGLMPGTSVHTLPPDAQVVQWSRDALGMRAPEPHAEPATLA